MTKFEAAARERKAAAMACVLVSHGADGAGTAGLPAAGRAMVAELAGCRPPSEATWARVCDLVAGAR